MAPPLFIHGVEDLGFKNQLTVGKTRMKAYFKTIILVLNDASIFTLLFATMNWLTMLTNGNSGRKYN